MAVLVSDAFTDTNGVALGSHVPDVDTVGGGWSEVSGTWAIQSNRCRLGTSRGGGQVAAIGAGEVPAAVSATCNFSGASGSYRGVFLCASSTGATGFLIAIHNTAGGRLRIVENASAIRASVNVPIPVGDFTLSATWDGVTITAQLDGANDIAYSPPSSPTHTHIGLRGRFAGDVWDDLMATSSGDAESIVPMVQHHRRQQLIGG